MPRELVFLSPEPPGDGAFRAAAAEIDGDAPLGHRLSMTLSDDGLLARFHSETIDPLLTVVHPTYVRSQDEIARLLPGHAPLPVDVEAFWWSEAFVPWGAAQKPGLALAAALHRQLGGVLVDLSSLSPGL